MLHPSVRLVLWLAGVAALQFFEGYVLAAATAAVVGICLALSPESVIRLLRKSRWLLASIAVFFVFGTPGVLLVPDLGWASPTREGGVAAAEHLARLVTIVALVGWLVGRTRPIQLLEGLHGLLAPLAALGLRRDRASVRLMLVLHYASDGTREQWRDWLAGGDSGVPGPGSFVLVRHALGRADLAVLALVGTVIAAALVVGRP